MSKLTMYRFFLPLATNAGLSTEHARKAWEAEALKLAGGFTLNAFADGVWKSPDAPRVFKDRIAPYDVACEPRVGAALEDAFWRLFPDQEALALVNLGPASIISRPADWNASAAATALGA
ncbi:MAG TPA: hypothetical protein VKQ30_16215 [Ktedonobacterales bacterium]|nr:hypothetical protein [Ktedonobacterales bacterium]